jgi:hypothetical protein
VWGVWIGLMGWTFARSTTRPRDEAAEGEASVHQVSPLRDLQCSTTCETVRKPSYVLDRCVSQTFWNLGVKGELYYVPLILLLTVVKHLKHGVDNGCGGSRGGGDTSVGPVGVQWDGREATNVLAFMGKRFGIRSLCGFPSPRPHSKGVFLSGGMSESGPLSGTPCTHARMRTLYGRGTESIRVVHY